MRKRRVKNVAAVLLVSVMLLTMAGCGKKFDPAAYVKASMDLVTRHDVDQYTKVTGTKKEEAEEIYQESLDELDDVTSLLGTAGFPEDLSNSYIELVKKALTKTKYTVKEATEKDGNYSVEVEVEPIMMFDGVEESLQEELTAYIEEVQEDINNGAEAPEEAEIMEKVYTMMLDIMDQNLEAAGYAEKKTVTAKINKNSDGQYEIDEASFTELGASLIDYEGFTGGISLE